MYNYGECAVCSTSLEEKNIQQDFWVKGRLVVIENVPAGVCPQCGEKIVVSLNYFQINPIFTSAMYTRGD